MRLLLHRLLRQNFRFGRMRGAFKRIKRKQPIRRKDVTL